MYLCKFDKALFVFGIFKSKLSYHVHKLIIYLLTKYKLFATRFT